MEEKKALTVRLSTVMFLFIIFLLVIALIVVYYFGFIKEHANETNSSVNSNVSSEIINDDDIQEDNLKIIENSSSSKYNQISTNGNDKKSNDVIDDTTSKNIPINTDEAKALYQKYLYLAGAMESSPSFLLSQLGFTLNDNFTANSENYIETNIKYQDYKNKMLAYVSETLFNEEFTNSYKNIDGFLYYFNGGASGTDEEVQDVTLKEQNSNQLIYEANVYTIFLDDTKSDLYTKKFALTKYGTGYVVDLLK